MSVVSCDLPRPGSPVSMWAFPFAMKPSQSHSTGSMSTLSAILTDTADCSGSPINA